MDHNSNHILVRLTDPRDGHSYLVPWSRVCDAPADRGQPFAQTWSTDPRIMRVIQSGTSIVWEDGHVPESGEDYTLFNRAGVDETCLTLEQLIDAYCLGRELERGYDYAHHSEEEFDAWLRAERRLRTGAPQARE